MLKGLNNKVILQEVKPKRAENEIIYEDKDAAKLGKVSFAFKGESVELKKGDEVYYQYGNDVKIEGENYTLVSESNLICLKS